MWIRRGDEGGLRTEVLTGERRSSTIHPFVTGDIPPAEARMRARILVPLLAVMMAACDAAQDAGATEPDPVPLFLAERDLSFRLTTAERARLPPMIDADVLEELAAWTAPEYRGDFVDFYVTAGEEGPIAFGPLLIESDNPHLDTLARKLVRTTPP